MDNSITTNQQNKPTMLSYALEYRKLGWSIFPIQFKGKKPIVEWLKFQHILPTDDEIRTWWGKYPNANIGLATGKVSGVVAFDFDNDLALEKFKTLVCDIIDYTIISKTPRGYHCIFKYNDDFPITNKIGVEEHVDIRGDGGYIVLPPSINKDNIKYKWFNINPIRDGLEELADIPDEIIDYMKKKSIQKENGTSNNDRGWVDKLMQGVEQGNRHNALIKLAGYFLRVNNMTKSTATSILKNWNMLNNPPLDDNDIFDTVNDIYVRYIKDKKEEIGKIKGTLKEAKANKKKEEKEEEKQAIAQEITDEINKFVSSINILQYPDNEDQYQVVSINGRSVNIPASSITSPTDFFRKTAKVIHRVFPPIKREIWSIVMNSYLDNAKIIHVDENETEIARIKEVLLRKAKEFVDNDILNSKAEIEFILKRYVYVYGDGTAVFKMSSFMRWIEDVAELKTLSRKEISSLLKIIGFKFDRKTRRIKSHVGKFWVGKYDDLVEK